MDLTKEQEKLAWELADTLNDLGSLAVYQSFVERYSEDFLRKTLHKVLAFPEEKIRKTRGALFTFLIKQHAQNSSHRSRR